MINCNLTVNIKKDNQNRNEVIILTIEKLSNTAVKITINKYEMMRYGVSFETLNENNAETRNMISDILTNMCLSTDINFTSARLFIEAFSVSAAGCILYISVINDDYEIYEPYIDYIFDFPGLSECIGFVKHMSENIRSSSQKSILYTSDGKRMLLYMDTAIEYEDYIVSSASEFGAEISSEELFVQFVDEHFECLINENAINALCSSSE